MITYKPSKKARLTWLLACDQNSSVGLCIQVTMHSSYDLRHPDEHTQTAFDSLYY